MQIDPVQEWQRLTADYRQKGDQELRELADDYADLTETAQQVLRGEMRSRGLGDPASPGASHAQQAPQARTTTTLPADSSSSSMVPDMPVSFGLGSAMPQLVSDIPETENPEDGPHDYTWKTVLCECETSEQAQQLVEALQRAGIDGWLEGAGSRTRYRNSDLAYPRVLVAADQLEQARIIATKPIPQDIVDKSNEEIPDFVEPKCPKCGSDDVVLESVDPENTWLCEQCDEQWTESSPATTEESPKG